MQSLEGGKGEEGNNVILLQLETFFAKNIFVVILALGGHTVLMYICGLYSNPIYKVFPAKSKFQTP